MQSDETGIAGRFWKAARSNTGILVLTALIIIECVVMLMVLPEGIY